MTEIHPHPGPFISFAAQFLVVSFLWGCTAEPPTQAPASRGFAASVGSTVGPGGNHPPAIISAKIYPVDVSLDTELRIEVKAEDMHGDRVTHRYQWFVNGIPAATGPACTHESSKNGDRITTELTQSDGKAAGAVPRTNP